jgi:hypothetical protein
MRSAAAPRATCACSRLGHAPESMRSVAVTSGLSLEGSPYDVSRQGCRRSSVPRKTRWAAGRRMARTAFPPASGSRRRGSVGGRPRYGGRAACPPVPSGLPSLATHGGARRPALYGGTSAQLALAPMRSILAGVPHVGDDPTLIGSERHPAFYTVGSRGVTACERWTMTPGRLAMASSPARGAPPSRSGCA